VGAALLVEYYDELPESQEGNPKDWEARLRKGLEKFKAKVAARYLEGTLHRLLDNGDTATRRASVLALGLVGTMKSSNAPLARMLHDTDRGVRQLAVDALWSIWFRADTDLHNRELQRLVELRDRRKKRAGLDALIHKASRFAECYNQRAILHFQTKQWQEAIQDCEKVLKLNRHHFAAAAGMGRCYLELGKNRAALKAFRLALRINPGMDEVKETIRALESALGEEREDRMG
jgi:tetratricopeptide (TPR) repeat protein